MFVHQLSCGQTPEPRATTPFWTPPPLLFLFLLSVSFFLFIFLFIFFVTRPHFNTLITIFFSLKPSNLFNISLSQSAILDWTSQVTEQTWLASQSKKKPILSLSLSLSLMFLFFLIILLFHYYTRLLFSGLAAIWVSCDGRWRDQNWIFSRNLMVLRLEFIQ